jgi:pyridinium-3,5-bisthiocarboxylic acid mononucleotide nickel chelatase
MRIAYLECFAGISGDMLLGALIDAGVPLEVLTKAAAALGLGAEVKVERVDRSGISCTKVHVLEGGHLAEHPHSHDAHHHSHEHAHAPKHSHGRPLKVIRGLIEAAPLAEPVKKTAIRAFELLGQSEAKIHNVDIEKIHFHEVGAVDAIIDIVAASAGIHHLSIDAWYCSPLNVGGGMVECAHGTFPVPAPATADLLRGYPTYSAHVAKELVTPTGAALLRVLDPVFGVQPAMRVERIGYGAGTRNPKGFPNALRISVGDAEEGARTETVTVLETALDDLSPQVLAWVAESALAAGALDVMLTPVVMKKGRAGTLLTVLCEPEDAQALERLILRETSTLGVRVRQDQRRSLERHHVAVSTAYGEIRMKVGMLGGEVMNAAPEFEDCRAAAVRCDVPLKVVQQAAVAAYASRVPESDKVGL